ncbi:MAG: hypothetical protein ABI988_01950 [Nitrospirota bacterium]
MACGSRAHVGQRQEDARRRVEIGRLQEEYADWTSMQLRVYVVTMVERCHDHSLPLRREPPCPVHCMLKHRPGSDEGAILFWSMSAQPAKDERLDSFSLSLANTIGHTFFFIVC